MSPSLRIGLSYLPLAARRGDVDAIVRSATRGIRRNPDLASEITMAASTLLIERVPEAELRAAFQAFVARACEARDESMRP